MVSLLRRLSMRIAGDGRKSKPAKPTYYLLQADLSLGKEPCPIQVLSPLEDDTPPTDFHYITSNCVTSDIKINRSISSLNWCDCKDGCKSGGCHCIKWAGGRPFYKNGRLAPDVDYKCPPVIYECNPACCCYANVCENRVVQNGARQMLQLFKTSNRGWGVRSLMEIPKGAFICEYVGEVISSSDGDSREEDSYFFALEPKGPGARRGGYLIDSRFYGNISRMVNHSCDPNAVAIKVYTDIQDPKFPKICFFAMRNIGVNEEISIDYGERYWVVKYKRYKMLCLCGSRKCSFNSKRIAKTVANWDKRAAKQEADLRQREEESAAAAAEAANQAADESGQAADEEAEEGAEAEDEAYDEEEGYDEAGDEEEEGYDEESDVEADRIIAENDEGAEQGEGEEAEALDQYDEDAEYYDEEADEEDYDEIEATYDYYDGEEPYEYYQEVDEQYEDEEEAEDDGPELQQVVDEVLITEPPATVIHGDEPALVPGTEVSAKPAKEDVGPLIDLSAPEQATIPASPKSDAGKAQLL